MTAVPTLTGAQVVQMQVAAVQASANANVDASQGSITLALVESVRGVFLWLQALYSRAVSLALLATRFGSDVDAWIAQIGLLRIAAVAASGSVTLSRITTGVAAFVPVGRLVSTGPGGVQFQVTADSTNSAYSAAQNGYTISASAASINVPVQCLSPGTAGNVASGAIGSFVTPIPYVDTVTNPAAFGNGINAESDAAVKARVPLYISGLRGAAPNAILGAALSVQQGLRVYLRNAYPGAGFYTLYVDDGSGGNAPDALISTVYAAVAAVTAEGVQPSVVRPTADPVTIVGQLAVAPGASGSTAGANASIAVAQFISSLPISDGGGVVGTLHYLDLPAIIKAADPNIISVTSLTLNGGTSDIVPPAGSLVTSSSITFD